MEWLWSLWQESHMRQFLEDEWELGTRVADEYPWEDVLWNINPSFVVDSRLR